MAEEKQNKTQEIKTGIDTEKTDKSSNFISENDTFILNERDIKKAQSGSPETKGIEPKEYKEQFYFQDDGTLWVNIANTWKQFTSGAVTTGSRVFAQAGRDYDIPASGNLYVVNTETEIFDTGSEFNTTSFLFTAAIEGYYCVLGSISAKTILESTKKYTLEIYKVSTLISQAITVGTGYAETIKTSSLVHLDAGDTLQMSMRNNGTGTLTLSSGAGTSISIYKI